MKKGKWLGPTNSISYFITFEFMKCECKKLFNIYLTYCFRHGILSHVGFLCYFGRLDHLYFRNLRLHTCLPCLSEKVSYRFSCWMDDQYLSTVPDLPCFRNLRPRTFRLSLSEKGHNRYCFLEDQAWHCSFLSEILDLPCFRFMRPRSFHLCHYTEAQRNRYFG